MNNWQSLQDYVSSAVRAAGVDVPSDRLESVVAQLSQEASAEAAQEATAEASAEVAQEATAEQFAALGGMARFWR